MSGGSDPPRTPIQLLWDRKFGLFFAGKLASSAGIWIQNITAAILVFNLTGSALSVGTVSMFQFAPQMLLAPWMGSLSDRVDRRRLLILGRAISLVASTNLAIWLVVLGDDFKAVWAVYATALVLGIGSTTSSPAMNALIPGLVPPKDLFGAIALNSSTGNIARAVGPAAGAALYVALGPALGFATSAAGHGLFIFALIMLGTTAGVPKSEDTSVRGGLRYLKSTPIMIVLLACVWGVGFAADAVITLTPPLAAELGRGEVYVGLFASAFGVGALVSLATAGAWERRLGLARVGVFGFVIMAVGFAVVALSPVVQGVMVGMFVAGYGFLLATSSVTSRIQKRVPETLRGRVMSIWAMGFLGSRPIAAFFNGAIADHVSLRAAVACSVLVSLLAGALAHFKAPAGASRLD